LSHGRSDAFLALYAGATSTGVPFPGTVSTFSPDAGETMAETRTRMDSTALEPSVDILYADAWSAANPGAPFSYLYANLTAPTPAPVNVNCIAEWTSACRIVINYETNIHPLWSAPRLVLDSMGVQIADHTCAQAGCHNPVDANAAAMVPAGQLNLTDGPSEDEPDQFNAYRELLFADNRQILNNGALQDEQIQIGVDALGNPILVPVSVGASMSSAGARVSGFFSCFDVGGTGCPTQSHSGYLSTGELKLIAEWLDIGAQYYNDPFDVPVM
jgi:hypothetical protein